MSFSARCIVGLVTVLSLLFLASCAAQPATRTVTFAQSGSAIDLRVGDTLLVALEGNPTTGFDWALVGSASPALDLAERSFAPSSTALGAAGTVTYRFKAVAQGSTDLVMNYSRSFESVPPERTFKLTVRVVPS
jgi:inhibitor of cysteine peptidase